MSRNKSSNCSKTSKQYETNLPSNESFDEKKSKPPPKGNILHIGNIHPQLNYQQIKQGLYNLFSIHGPIYDITIKTKENGTHFAFVDFPDTKDAEKALVASKKQGKVLQNQQLIVNYCEDPKKNEARKGAKCFLCHGTGHKAINCTVKPELIKQPKKITSSQFSMNSQSREEKKGFESFSFSRDQLHLSSVLPKNEQSYQESEDEEDSSEESFKQSDVKNKHKTRDKDYLRFLKMKKKYLEDKLKKKIIKSRRH